MKILLTGFDAFADDTINPSWLAINAIEDNFNNHEIIKVLLPTVFNLSSKILIDEINKHNPDIVICFGQAKGRSAISVERVAINVDDALICDNQNNKPIDMPIIKNGPNAYFSYLPIKAIVKSLNDNNIEAIVSNSAGTFVCNHVMYSLLHHCKSLDIKAGFIHIPCIKEQSNNKYPYMELDKIIHAIKIIITTIINSYKDITYTNSNTY